MKASINSFIILLIQSNKLYLKNYPKSKFTPPFCRIMINSEKWIIENKLLLVALAGIGVWILAGYIVHHIDKINTLNELKASLPEGGRVLNVGAKNYWMFKNNFDDLKVTNIDVVKRDTPNFVLADVRNLQIFDDDQFDATIASHVLEHIPSKDVPMAISEMKRVTEDSENVFIVLPRPYFPDSWLYPSHKWVPVGDKRQSCKLLKQSNN